MKVVLLSVTSIAFYVVMRIMGAEVSPGGAVIIGAIFGLLGGITD